MSATVTCSSTARRLARTASQTSRQRHGRTVVGQAVRPGAPDVGQRALDGPDDVGDRDLVRGLREAVAAVDPPLGGDQAGPLQLVEDVLQEALRDRLRAGEALAPHRAAALAGELAHRPHRVVHLRCDPHRTTSLVTIPTAGPELQPQPPSPWRPRATLPPVTEEHSPVQTTDQAHTAETAGHDEHGPADREWTHDPLERSFFGTVGRGYVIGIIVFGLFAFAMIRTQAKDWGVAAAIGAAAFVAFFAGVLGGVVLIGLWAMKNEELIRGNEAGEPGAGGWVGDSERRRAVTAPPRPRAEAGAAAEPTGCRVCGRRRTAASRAEPAAEADAAPAEAAASPPARRPRPPPILLPRPPAPPDGGLTAPRIARGGRRLRSSRCGRFRASASARAAPRAVAPRAAGHEPALVVGRAHPRPVPLGRPGRRGRPSSTTRSGSSAWCPGPASTRWPPTRASCATSPRSTTGSTATSPAPAGSRPGRTRRQPAAAGGLLLAGVRHRRGAAAVLRRPRGAGRRPPEGVERPRRPARRRRALLPLGLLQPAAHRRRHGSRSGSPTLDPDAMALTRCDGIRIAVDLAGEPLHGPGLAGRRRPRPAVPARQPTWTSNTPEVRAVTDRLYGGDTEHRIRQEILLGIGGVRALQALGLDAAGVPHQRGPRRLPRAGAHARSWWRRPELRRGHRGGARRAASSRPTPRCPPASTASPRS